ncbi:MAG: hypothetical protein EBZ95_05910 [Chitinophagia bacterium]|nr:hypothetical protein [Chitinophagia bacterium]
MTIHPQYIKDANVKRSLVVIAISEFDKIMEELESIEDVKLYDQAKKKNGRKGILLDDYIHQREINNV